MPHANPIQIQKYLKGVDYPATKSELIENAKNLGADDNICASLEQLPDEDFQTPAEVSQAFKGPSTDVVEAKAAPSPPSQEAKKFIEQVVEDSMAEIEMCMLALDKSTNPEVKKLAQQMIDEHGKFGQEIEQLAKQLKIALPKKLSAQHKSAIDEMEHLKPPQFDKRFIEQNLKYHENDLKVFKHYAKEEGDQTIAQFAESGVHMFTKHLKQVKDLDKKLKQ